MEEDVIGAGGGGVDSRRGWRNYRIGGRMRRWRIKEELVEGMEKKMLEELEKHEELLEVEVMEMKVMLAILELEENEVDEDVRGAGAAEGGGVEGER